MRKLLLFGALLLVVIFLFGGRSETPAVIAEESPMALGRLEVYASTTLQVSATAYGVFDVATGELLFGDNVDEIRPIASITKLFTAASVLEAASSSEAVAVTTEDVETYGSAGGLLAGQVYQVRELLFPLLLESSNDAATALGRLVGEIPFADRVLADASGLANENTASVREIGSEVRKVYNKLPEVFDITKLSQYVGEHTGWRNNSPVRDLPGYQGGKHGYTEAANRTLVALFTEPSLNDRTIEYVLLGSDDIRADTIALREVLTKSVRIVE